MKISEKDKNLLLMTLGIGLLAIGYFSVYVPQMDEAAAIEAENAALQRRLSELLEMEDKKDFYETEIQRMNAEVQNYCQTFPADIRQEDGILLAGSMEKKIDMRISNAGLGEKEFVASLNGGRESSGTGEQQPNLSARSAQSTQDALNEIEGTNDAVAVGSADRPAYGGTEALLGDAGWNPVLYRTKNSFQFVTDYKGLKRAVNFLNEQTGRVTVDNVSASFDSSTGKLSGSIGVNLFSMSGTGAEYSEPDAGKVRLGTKNIFGTIEKKEKKKN